MTTAGAPLGPSTTSWLSAGRRSSCQSGHHLLEEAAVGGVGQFRILAPAGATDVEPVDAQFDQLEETVDAVVSRSEDGEPFGEERRAIESFKKTALMVFGVAMQTYGTALADQQEILTAVADILIDVYSAESALLRAAAAQSGARASLHADAARTFVSDAAGRIEIAARQALAVMTNGDTLRTMLAGLRRLSKFVPFDTVTLRRRLADEAVARGGYIF